MTDAEKQKFMVRKSSYFLVLIVLVVLVSSGFSSFKIERVPGFHVNEKINVK